MRRSRPAEIDSLLQLSSRLGANPMLVQGSTGNTSLKWNGVLWIKASGKWLVDAVMKDILVPVNLAETRRRLREGGEPISSETAGSESGLRASIETGMHTVLPHPVVVHVHSINAIAWAVRKDARERLQERLAGVAWQWIPYTPSGRALACEIERVISRHPDTDLFVLGNHGLVVGGSDCQAAEALLSEVESRLRISPRPSSEPDLKILEQTIGYSEWRLPPDQELHALATDNLSRSILTEGVLYPCQRIFLRTNAKSFPSGGETPQLQPFLILNGSGLLIRNSISRAEYAILLGLSRVIQRIDSTAPLRYLEPDEINSLEGFESRQYRELCEHKSRLVETLATA